MGARGGAASTPLTADLVARAVIAAALTYGDDPVKACTGTAAQHRRALTAAAGGLHLGLEVSIARLEQILAVKRMTIYHARWKRAPAFLRAELAAMRAVEFASWRPEAAESVAGVATADEIEPTVALDEVLAPPSDDAAAAMLVAPIAPEPVSEPDHDDVAATLSVLSASPPRPAHAAVRFAPVAPTPATTMEELVLQALAGGESWNTMSLASMIDRKEMAVVSALSMLAAQGHVESEACDGPRRFRWKLTSPAVAA